MNLAPSVMDFGSFSLISPDGTETIPADCWPELELMLLLEPEPAELKVWTRRLEDRLGVTDRHRNTLTAPWYIFRAATRQEKRACESLTELGIEHYLPCETVHRKLNKVAEPFERALFPGYLFARVADQDFHAATHAAGVHAPVRVFSSAGEYVPKRVPAGLIKALQEAQGRGEFDRTVVPTAAPIEPGDSIRVTSGPFEAMVGAMLELRGKDRVAILISGRTLEVATAQIEPLA